ncbi:MAG: phytanoyl-CoA dioxygenase family protein [Pseudomonadota bacterium]
MNEPVTELFASRFARDGFGVVRHCLGDDTIDRARRVVETSLDPLLAPVEYEAEVGYPGSPRSLASPGGLTPRRLLHAYSRHEIFRELASHPDIAGTLGSLFANERILMSQCHHNCVMTKQPGFSSKTLWHQDIRYWSFDEPELISVWIALGEERSENGALWVIPGSHQLALDRGRLDHALFLRPELAENRELIDQAVVMDLSPGDVLFFHCRLFHAAGANRTEQVKLSSVFTYHTENNQPIPDTRSHQYPSIPVI